MKFRFRSVQLQDSTNLLQKKNYQFYLFRKQFGKSWEIRDREQDAKDKVFGSITYRWQLTNFTESQTPPKMYTDKYDKILTTVPSG